MPALLLGTANQDKALELAALLQGLPWEVHSLREFPELAAPEETGTSFEENALLKAQYYAQATGLPAVADDSGLVVDALRGAPGIYSARYAGPGCSYADNNAKLLQELENVPWHERTARFVCAAAVIIPGRAPHVEVGSVEGHISQIPAGENGFGYDPLFVPLGEDPTFAGMSAEEKHQISHRGKAFSQLRRYLESLK